MQHLPLCGRPVGFHILQGISGGRGDRKGQEQKERERKSGQRSMGRQRKCQDRDANVGKVAHLSREGTLSLPPQDIRTKQERVEAEKTSTP